MIRNFKEHAANERTFLAWVRTATTVVGFGLAVARLGDRKPEIYSELALVIIGALIVLIAYFRMARRKRQIEADGEQEDSPMLGDLLLLFCVSGLFLLIAAFGLHVL